MRPRFPYSVYYLVSPDRVEVLAFYTLAATPMYGGNARRRDPLSNAELTQERMQRDAAA